MITETARRASSLPRIEEEIADSHEAVTPGERKSRRFNSDAYEARARTLLPSRCMRKSLILIASLLVSLSASADLIIPETAAPRILVPAAGNAPGSGGTYFRSDIQIANLRNVPQRVLMYWLPQGSSGAAIAPVAIDLAAQRGFSSEDFVANVLSQSGVGAIEFVGVNQQGQFDSGARLHVTSRIWTPRPDGADGTMSQPFPSIILDGETEPNEKMIFGMRFRSQFRINVGIANPAPTTQRFRVNAIILTNTVEENVTFEVEVPARAIVQSAVNGLTRTGVVQVNITKLTPGISEWQAWGSTVDNFSGDAWSQMAFPSSNP